MLNSGAGALPGHEAALAFDGDTSTWFQSASVSNDYAGLSLGGAGAVVGSIQYFPAPGKGQAMVNGNFLGSLARPAEVTVISRVETSDGRAVNYDYQAFQDPGMPNTWQTLTAARYGDGTAAAYTYAQVYPLTRPLVTAASDPRVEGAGTRLQWQYDRSASNVLGYVVREINGATGATLLSIGSSGWNTPVVTYANGARVTYDTNHDTSLLDRKTDALGNKTTYVYDQNGYGYLIARTDALGRTTRYTNSAQGNPLTITYADNSAESWTRDDLDLELTHTDARGFTTTTTRDARHRITHVDYPDNSFETWSYNDNATPLAASNGFGQVATHRLRNGGTESFTYDARGLKTAWTDAEGQTTTYVYDAADRLAGATDSLGHATAYQSSERGLLTRVTYADNSSVSYGYDAWGNHTSVTNELGKTWTSTFDEFKRLTAKTDPLNRTTTHGYDLPGSGGCGSCQTSGTPASVTLPSGKRTEFTYDLAWRKTAQTVGAGTPDAATTSYGYDAVGNLTSTVDPRGKVWTFTFDSRNRRTQATNPLNHATQWTHDAKGNRLTETRADNGVTRFAYDAMNRLTATTDPLNQITRQGYDAAGRLATLTDARNNAYGFTYDQRNHKLSMSYPDGSHEDWTYDAAGNPATYRTRAGQVKTCTYDVRNRDVLCDWSDSTPDVTKSYDLAGRVLTMNNSNSALTYTYDDAGQLLGETQNIAGGPGARTVAFTYDQDGNRASLAYPDGHLVAYAYTGRNQIAGVTLDGPPPLTTYSYDLTGNRVGKTLENGTVTTYAYDDAGRLTSLVHGKAGATFASFAYAYDTTNNRTSVTREDGSGDAYAYDAGNQLTGVQYGATSPATVPTSPQRTQAFAYDPVGNRTSAGENATTTAYTANALNQYTQVGTATSHHDANGNFQDGFNDAAGATSCVYDAQNRLSTAYFDQWRGKFTILNVAYAIAYDARNRPVKRTIGAGIPTYLVYDGWNLVAEFSGSAQTARYVHGAQVDEVLARFDSAGAATYHHHDGLGSTAVLTSASGAVAERYRYDAFGTPRFLDGSGTARAASTCGNGFLFTGREWLAEVGLYDYRNRVYTPGLGRFLQVDPLRFSANDNNLYRYVSNMPSQLRDPSGLISEEVRQKARDRMRRNAEEQGRWSGAYICDLIGQDYIEINGNKKCKGPCKYQCGALVQCYGGFCPGTIREYYAVNAGDDGCEGLDQQITLDYQGITPTEPPSF